MASALGLCLLVMPLWAFGGSLAVLAAGAFFMQMGVQGAWGIIPAHLNELSPDETRGLVPGLAYQLGILLASPVNTIEYALRDRIGYGWALASFEAAVILVLRDAALARPGATRQALPGGGGLTRAVRSFAARNPTEHDRRTR